MPIKRSSITISVDNRPSDYEYALLSKDVYEGAELKDDYFRSEGINWEPYKSKAADLGYFGAIYVNDKTRQVVLAHRGTNSMKAIFEDMAGIFANKISPQKEASFVFLKEAIDLVKNGEKKGYHLSFTGHSLGAFLAELSVFYAHSSFGFTHVNAVTFESPGSKESMDKLQSNLEPIQLEKLDIVSYVSYPNRINTCNKHVGTLYQLFPDLGDRADLPVHYIKKSHSMAGILEVFQKDATHTPHRQYMSDWPQMPSFYDSSQHNNFFNHAELKEGRYVLKNSDPLLAEQEEELKGIFSRYYQAHYRSNEGNGYHTIALRHFLPNMQDFLIRFFEQHKSLSVTSERKDQLKEQLEKDQVPEPISRYLSSYRLVEDNTGIIKLQLDEEFSRTDSIAFRYELSKWLNKQGDGVSKLLTLPNLPSKNLPERWNVPNKNELFSGRVALLQQIENHLAQERVPTTLIAYHGLGGVGKTQLILEFVWQHYKEYTGVAWFNAESTEQLLNDYSVLALELNLITDNKMTLEEKGHFMRRWFETSAPAGWLLVYDNAPRYGGEEGISTWLPTAGGNVLITSRYSEGWPQSYAVDVFTAQESKEFIEKVLGEKLSDEDKTSIDTLTETLGHLPLALAQAAAYIKKSGMKISRYLEVYQQRKAHFLQDKTLSESAGTLPAEYKKNMVYITWDITMEAIRNESPLAANWLYSCAYLASNDIPDFLFASFAKDPKNNPNNELYEEARGILNSYSMLSIQDKSQSASIHPLVQEVIQLKEIQLAQISSGSKTAFQAVIKLLNHPYDGKDTRKDRGKQQALLPHFEALLSYYEVIKQKVSVTLERSEENKKQEIREKIRSLELHHIIPALTHIANAYRYLGDRIRERAFLKGALAIYEKYNGENPIKVAETLMDLAATYGPRDVVEQRDLLKRALLIFEATSDANFRDHMGVLLNLATLYGELEEKAEQQHYRDKALYLLRAQHDSGNPEIASLLEAFGGRLTFESIELLAVDAGESRAFLTKIQTILESNESETEDSLEKANTLEGLGEQYGRLLQDWEMKQQLLERALTIKKKIYGDDSNHIEIVETLLSLGISYGLSGDIDRKKELLENALLRLERGYSKDHPEITLFTLAHLTRTYRLLGDEDKHQELSRRVSDLLEKYMSSYFPDDANQATSSGAACLSGGRKKRNTDNCLFDWEDIDEFNLEKEATRNRETIQIDSEKFIRAIRGMPEAKQAQLIQLASEVPVKGLAHGKVKQLIKWQKIQPVFQRVGRYSSMLTYGMMGKVTLAAFLRGDNQRAAVNIGFIAGGYGLSKLSGALSLQGVRLASNGKLWAGRSLKAASPFLARGPSAFIAYDLVNQVKALQSGDKDALVGVVGDSVYLGVDAVEVGIEVAEAFEVLEGVSSITGPIGATIGAVVFVGTDIYEAVKQVDKIDALIHLTRSERFFEGLRAFFGMQPEPHIMELMQEKQLDNQLVAQKFSYLKQHPSIQRYVFSAIDAGTCRNVPVLQYTSGELPASLNGKMVRVDTMDSSLITYKKECTSKFQVALDNRVMLGNQRSNITWDRAWPDQPIGGKLFCLPPGPGGADDEHDIKPSYECSNAIGLADNSTNKTSNYTLIDLGEGYDFAQGFIESPNIFLVSKGAKGFFGGDKDDLFFLQGSNVSGVIKGMGGTNTLDVGGYANAQDLAVYLDKNKLYMGEIKNSRLQASSSLHIESMQRLLAREGEADQISCACDTQYVDGRGGANSSAQDAIFITAASCAYQLQCIVRPYTIINNQATQGIFSYVLPTGKGDAQIYLHNEPNPSRHDFFFNYTLFDLKQIAVEGDSANHRAIFHFANRTITISPSNPNISYQLSDHMQLRVGKPGKNNIIYAVQESQQSVEEIIKDYSPLAESLQLFILVQSLLRNETVMIGHGYHDVMQNNPACKSHLIGNSGENTYVISAAEAMKGNFRLPMVTLYCLDGNKNSTDTLDLRPLIQGIEKDTGNDVQVKIGSHGVNQDYDLLLRVMTNSPNYHQYVTIRLKAALNNPWYKKLHVVTHHTPLIITQRADYWQLTPLPLVFDKAHKEIIVKADDVESGTELQLPHKAACFSWSRSGEDLIVSNAFDPEIEDAAHCTLMLYRFYQDPKMRTLTLQFNDQKILLQDKIQEINAAPMLSDRLQQYKKAAFSQANLGFAEQPRQSNNRVQRHTRVIDDETSISSSATRPSFWIQELFSAGLAAFNSGKQWMQQRLFTFDCKVPAAANVAYHSQATNQANFFKSLPPPMPNNTQTSLSVVDYSQLDLNANLLLGALLMRQKLNAFVQTPLTSLDELDHAVNRAILKYQKLN